MSALGWVKSHPYETGGLVFVGGVVVLYVLGFFSGGSSASSASSGDANAAAYFAAESQQAQSGNALMAVEDQDQAATAQTALNDAASVQTNTVWANTNLSENTSNNATTVTTTQLNDAAAVSVAPLQVEDNLITTLGNVASLPGSTQSVTLPIGNGQYFSASTVAPNPSAVSADGLLASLVSNGFNASH